MQDICANHTLRNFANSTNYITEPDAAKQPRLSVVLVTMETLNHYAKRNDKKNWPFFDIVFVAPGASFAKNKVGKWFDCNLTRKPKYDPRSLMLCTFHTFQTDQAD